MSHYEHSQRLTEGHFPDLGCLSLRGWVQCLTVGLCFFFSENWAVSMCYRLADVMCFPPRWSIYINIRVWGCLLVRSLERPTAWGIWNDWITNCLFQVYTSLFNHHSGSYTNPKGLRTTAPRELTKHDVILGFWVHILLVQCGRKEFHIPTATIDALLMFYWKLNHQGLILIAEWLKSGGKGIELGIFCGLETWEQRESAEASGWSFPGST